MTNFHTPLYNFCFLYLSWLSQFDYWVHLLYLPFLWRTYNYTGCIILITGMLIACFGMVLNNTTFMIRTKLAKLHNLPLDYIQRLLFIFLVLLTIFGTCFPPSGYLFFGHLLLGSILNHLMHSKGVECILMFLSAMPRGVSVTHICVLNLPLHICKWLTTFHNQL